MDRKNEFSKAEVEIVNEIMASYDRNFQHVSLFRDQFLQALSSSERLSKLVHSFRSRLKDKGHLRAKLFRKLGESKKDRKQFQVTPENLLVTVNDLVGFRILHLHTRQIQQIDVVLREIFKEGHYKLMEKPFARTWDDETRDFFKTCSISTQRSPSLYTSVHYVIGSASRTKVTAEIQVRTLMEEVWGEVDHTINYPVPSKSIACREQLKVLARVTSSASRLVDSIFSTHEEGKIPTRKEK